MWRTYIARKISAFGGLPPHRVQVASFVVEFTQQFLI
jgi:hypothetical protein